MRSNNLSLAFLLLLAGQGIYAQQSFELPLAPSKLAASQAATTPKTNKPKKSVASFYTGNVKITLCNDKKAVGIDLATGKTVAIIPRFKGVVVGGVFRFDRNRILQNDREIVIAPEPGKEDYCPYVVSPNATKGLGGAAGAAVQTAGTMLNLLNSFKR
jgi:hypothetical protein